MNIIERLKYIRESVLKMSQVEFAQKLKVSQKTVSRWEQGINEPQLSAIKPLLEEYNINLNWLISGKGEIFNNSSAQDLILQGNTTFVEIEKDEVCIVKVKKNKKAGKPACIDMRW